VPCELIVLEGAGHHFPDDYGKRATSALLDWFDKHLGASAIGDRAKANTEPASVAP
jgi:hypothetical protein